MKANRTSALSRKFHFELRAYAIAVAAENAITNGINVAECFIRPALPIFVMLHLAV